MEEEQEHEGGNTAMTSLLTESKTEDGEDNVPIINLNNKEGQLRFKVVEEEEEEEEE